MSDTQVIADRAVFDAMSSTGAYKSMALAMIRKNDADAELAENLAKEQHFKTSIAALKWEQERITTESMQDALQRSKQLKRPCMTLGITVSPQERGDRIVYIARWSHLESEGETPEMACANFDRMWVGGNDEL